MFKFRDREETLFYSFVYKELEARTVSELLKEARRKGAFSLPYHAVVLKNGELDLMRPFEAVGGSELPYSACGVYILVDAESKESLSALQKKRLDDLIQMFHEDYADIVEEEFNKDELQRTD